MIEGYKIPTFTGKNMGLKKTTFQRLLTLDLFQGINSLILMLIMLLLQFLKFSENNYEFSSSLRTLNKLRTTSPVMGNWIRTVSAVCISAHVIECR